MLEVRCSTSAPHLLTSSPFIVGRMIRSLTFVSPSLILDDSDEETSSSSSADAPSAIPRRSKFDDEEDDSDVRFLRSLYFIDAKQVIGARILGRG